uniref:C-type lectin domain-containing protein n=1 Tax=Panagrolaimus davidi TaxID=227884 RepID=A0A914P942_9BILA
MNFNSNLGQLIECPIGWQKGEFCGGIFCYFKLSVPPIQRATAVEQNICQTVHPLAHVVSIHCNPEMQFLVQFGKFVIGLYIPSNLPWTKTGFRWEDQSPLDFDGWDHGIPDQPDNQLSPERNVEFRTSLQRFGWNDLPLIFFEAVVCKITLRSYGSIPQSPYNPANPYPNPYPPNQYPYPPYTNQYPQQQQQQQTPQPRLVVEKEVVANPNILQPFAAPPASSSKTEVIIEPSVISVVSPVPVILGQTPPPPSTSLIQAPPPIQHYFN